MMAAAKPMHHILVVFVSPAQEPLMRRTALLQDRWWTYIRLPNSRTVRRPNSRRNCSFPDWSLGAGPAASTMTTSSVSWGRQADEPEVFHFKLVDQGAGGSDVLEGNPARVFLLLGRQAALFHYRNDQA